ncbi:OmpA family protein [Photobacterium damselae]|nr:OmpA family protein [Photobacterium damselae]
MNYCKLSFVALAAAILSACSSQPELPSIQGDYVRINNQAQARINDQQQQIAILYYQMQELMNQKQPTPINVAPHLYQLFFPYNSARMPLTPELRYEILPQALQATRINLLGRTDGIRPSKRDQQIALERALNVRDYLVNNGVEATKIYLNYASALDYVDNNWSVSGRANNRRVEIELYLPTPE